MRNERQRPRQTARPLGCARGDNIAAARCGLRLAVARGAKNARPGPEVSGAVAHAGTSNIWKDGVGAKHPPYILTAARFARNLTGRRVFQTVQGVASLCRAAGQKGFRNLFPEGPRGCYAEKDSGTFLHETEGVI